ncbi:DUF4166 domain-containing protein [uncultured Tateyamaria sp.]|uniref:DUF4166 domain-containing protein n=1 Tax=uncultured Tateyamaria sp. TaxID=455651 RepID=UPI00262F34AB|nr:DUF4166 domain-containing protein [uncultured Tateyamaria sp.]
MLGDRARDLPAALLAFHRGECDAAYIGTVTVRQGNALVRLLCRLGDFPAPMTKRPMRMSIACGSKGERWNRDFDGHILSSTMRQVSPIKVAERFGPFDVHMCPSVTQAGLNMPVTGIRMFGVPLARRLFRGSGGREAVDKDGQITFHVSSRVMGLGCVIDYNGTLMRASDTVSLRGGAQGDM